jgi:hypothetical protein
MKSKGFWYLFMLTMLVICLASTPTYANGLYLSGGLGGANCGAGALLGDGLGVGVGLAPAPVVVNPTPTVINNTFVERRGLLGFAVAHPFFRPFGGFFARRAAFRAGLLGDPFFAGRPGFALRVNRFGGVRLRLR